ncbi:hypothetical protein K501DRAFT_280326 [Backusella circina FSU 941]|nr:hypothetical protein K501DRAFT_280326 [Backusella circina FSU 941]
MEDNTVQSKSIEEVEAEFKWSTTERVQLDDIITDFRTPNNLLVQSQQVATMIAIDLSEANLPEEDVQSIDGNMRQMIDLQAKLTSQQATLRTFQERLSNKRYYSPL